MKSNKPIIDSNANEQQDKIYLVKYVYFDLTELYPNIGLAKLQTGLFTKNLLHNYMLLYTNYVYMCSIY